MTHKAYITLGEVSVGLLAACAIGWIVKWGSSAMLGFLLGHKIGDAPSNWDLIRLISLYSGIVAGILVLLWLLGRRRRGT